MTPSGPSSRARGKRRVAAVGAIVVEARRIDVADAAEQAQAGAARVLRLRRGRGAPQLDSAPDDCPLDPEGERVGVRGHRRPSDRPARRRSPARPRPRTARAPRARARRARGTATAVTRVRRGACLRSSSSSPRAARQPARDVVADVDDRLRLRLDREHRVEGRDAVGVGRRDGEALADVVERARGDPADARLRRPRGRAGAGGAGARAAWPPVARWPSSSGRRSPPSQPLAAGPSRRPRPRAPRRWRRRRG